MRVEVFKETTDDWYPSYKMDGGRTMLVEVSFLKLGPRGYRDWETDQKSTRLNSSHSRASRMPSSA